MRCSECSKLVRPVVAVDIDGTLGNYHGHFLRFAENYLGYETDREDFDGTWPMSVTPFKDWFIAAFGVDERTWRDIKLAYRQGGMKRSMPVFTGAERFMTDLWTMGIEIWLTTTRPYLRLDTVDPDTRAWLERHHIRYHALLYDEDKYAVLAQHVDPERVIMVLDDLPEQVEAAERLFPGRAVMRESWYNRAVAEPYRSVRHLEDATSWASGALDRWRTEHAD